MNSCIFLSLILVSFVASQQFDSATQVFNQCQQATQQFQQQLADQMNEYRTRLQNGLTTVLDEQNRQLQAGQIQPADAQRAVDNAQAENDRQVENLQGQHNNALAQQAQQCQQAVDTASANDRQAANAFQQQQDADAQQQQVAQQGGGGGGRTANVLAQVQNGLNIGGGLLGGTRLGGLFNGASNILGGIGGFFRAETDVAQEGEAGFIDEGFVDEAALAAADPNVQQLPTQQQTAVVSAAPATPAWAIALIVLCAIVFIALVVVQVQLVMLRKKASTSVGAPEFA
jgi:DNA polymerase III alpha subunit (gram-positive type)